MNTSFDVRFLRHLECLARTSGAETGWTRHRDYSPGDDYRYVDWSVCARHDELVSRECPGGADRPVYVLLDSSRSMSVGDPSKFEVAVRIAAAVGAAALGRLDRVAMATFAGGIVDELPPIRGRSRLLKLARFLASQTPDGAASDFARAAEALVRRRHGPGPVVVVGDFFDPESHRRGLGTLQSRGYHPRMVHVVDAGEESPELVGDVELCDAESGASWVATLDENDIARYLAAFAGFCRSARAFCLRKKIPYIRVRGDTPWSRVVFEATGLRISG
jgi:uncharacterized protein (DUF58 family)